MKGRLIRFLGAPGSLMVVAFLLDAASVVAQTEQKRPPSSGGGICGALVMYYICSKRKDREIGGWLLYYYIQLYIGVLVSVGLTMASWENYVPSAWEGTEPYLYFWFLASTVPGVLLLPLQLIVAETLRLTRRAAVRWVLVAVLAADLLMSVLGLVIDAIHFPDNLGFGIIGVIWPCIWLPYFILSKRVHRVFVTKEWLPLTPPVNPTEGAA